MGIIPRAENASDALEYKEVLKGQLANVIESEHALLLAEVENVVEQLNEANDLEKKRMNNHMRETLVSSLDYYMGSPSHGSLTVYEKIPSKQGRGDEEAITPVRHSSRIRNLATSLKKPYWYKLFRNNGALRYALCIHMQ